MNEELTLEMQYAEKLLMSMHGLFNGDEETDAVFNVLEIVNDGRKLRCFLHALSNIVPGMIYNQITGNETDLLQFNHIANELVFEFCEKELDN